MDPMEEQLTGEQSEDDEELELSSEEIAENNEVLLDAVIDLLVEKGIFTEEELQKKLEEGGEDDEEEDESSA